MEWLAMGGAHCHTSDHLLLTLPLQQTVEHVVNVEVAALDGMKWHFPLGIESGSVHKISSLIYTLQLLYRT
jgi:hypothetical protein